jgi:hypothetical protein
MSEQSHEQLNTESKNMISNLLGTELDLKTYEVDDKEEDQEVQVDNSEEDQESDQE